MMRIYPKQNMSDWHVYFSKNIFQKVVCSIISGLGKLGSGKLGPSAIWWQIGPLADLVANWAQVCHFFGAPANWANLPHQHFLGAQLAAKNRKSEVNHSKKNVKKGGTKKR